MCTEAGGSFIDLTGYMVHVWSVPGYESPDGMFTELNRKVTCPDGTCYDPPRGVRRPGLDLPQPVSPMNP